MPFLRAALIKKPAPDVEEAAPQEVIQPAVAATEPEILPVIEDAEDIAVVDTPPETEHLPEISPAVDVEDVAQEVEEYLQELDTLPVEDAEELTTEEILPEAEEEVAQEETTSEPEILSDGEDTFAIVDIESPTAIEYLAEIPPAVDGEDIAEPAEEPEIISEGENAADIVDVDTPSEILTESEEPATEETLSEPETLTAEETLPEVEDIAETPNIEEAAADLPAEILEAVSETPSPEPETEPEQLTDTEPPAEQEQEQESEPPAPVSTRDYSGDSLNYDFTSGERYVDSVSTKTEFDKMLDELSDISKDLLSWQVEKFAKEHTSKFQGGFEKSESDAKKYEAFLGGYITNAAMTLYDNGYKDIAIKQLDQAKSILEARRKLEEETQAIKTRVEEDDDAVDLTDILGLFGD